MHIYIYLISMVFFGFWGGLILGCRAWVSLGHIRFGVQMQGLRLWILDSGFRV